MESGFSLDIQNLRDRIRKAGSLSDVYEELRRRLEGYPDPSLWISRVEWARVLDRVDALESQWEKGADPFLRFPLFGLPFAVKDNIDVAGMETTAACPAFAYRPREDAAVVRRLIDAGAVLIGKTNMDQFATGLVGTRSPYGTVRNPFHPAHVPGGSSSGSAVAVSAGLVAFSLGTDTAGSGRVPAGFNNVVGLKPSRGLLSNRGVFPACRSLDCVSIFALTIADAAEVFAAARGFDPSDPFSRDVPTGSWRPGAPFRFGFPDPAHLDLADGDSAGLFREAIARLENLGGEAVEIPFEPFAEAARLLYQGPWLAERQAAFGSFVAERPGEVLPVIREILSPAAGLTAEAGFRAYYRIRELRAKAREIFRDVDLLLVPTAPLHPTRDAVAADPIRINSRLGTYTNFVNLLDLCALAVPSGLRADGLPFGVTLIAGAFREDVLAAVGPRFHAAARLPLGATGHPLPVPFGYGPNAGPPTAGPVALLAVAGLHLSGQPLNGQLRELGARLRGSVRTAPCYRMYLIERPGRRFPGLVRTANGAALELEVWEMSPAALGAFMEKVAEPLCIGTVELEGGEKVKGFLCESWAAEGARDISAFGGWRAYLAQG